MDGIRVMAAADNKLQCILGTDVCSPKGTIVRERGTAIIDGNKVLQMEIGTSGLVFDVPMVSHGAGLGAELVVGAVVDGGDVASEQKLVDTSQAWALKQYAQEEHFNLAHALTNLVQALEENKPVMEVRCRACDATCCTQLSRGPFPKHLCSKCKEWTRTPVPVVANPLAQFGPIISKGQVFFSKLTFRPSAEAGNVGH